MKVRVTHSDYSPDVSGIDSVDIDPCPAAFARTGTVFYLPSVGVQRQAPLSRSVLLKSLQDLLFKSAENVFDREV